MKKEWNKIFTFCVSYPINPTDNDKQEAKTFVYDLPNILRCNRCIRHMIEYLENYNNIEFIFESNHNLTNFFITFYNDIKKNQKKPINSLDEIYLKYDIKKN